MRSSPTASWPRWRSAGGRCSSWRTSAESARRDVGARRLDRRRASQTAGLLRVPDRGGAPVPLTTLDKSVTNTASWPDALPGRRGPSPSSRGRHLDEAASKPSRSRRRATLVLAGARVRPLHAGRRALRSRWPGHTVGFDLTRPPSTARRSAPGRDSLTTGATAGVTWRVGVGRADLRPGNRSRTSKTVVVGREGHSRAVDTPRRFRDLRRSRTATHRRRVGSSWT